MRQWWLSQLRISFVPLGKACSRLVVAANISW
jgi:hypothetical protein